MGPLYNSGHVTKEWIFYRKIKSLPIIHTPFSFFRSANLISYMFSFVFFRHALQHCHIFHSCLSLFMLVSILWLLESGSLFKDNFQVLTMLKNDFLLHVYYVIRFVDYCDLKSGFVHHNLDFIILSNECFFVDWGKNNFG